MNNTGQAILGLCLIVSSIGGAAATDAPPPSATSAAATASLVVDKALHFQAAEGGSVALGPGSYAVEATAAAALRLISASGKSLVVSATAATHLEKLSQPQALIVPVSEDEQHLVLLLPDGKRLEAIGSLSGIHSRGLARP